MSHDELYQAILMRRSVRRYDRTPLDEPTLAQVRAIVAGVRPLVPGNQFHALLRELPPGADPVRELGGYGRIVNPPHYLVPYVVGERHALTDLGCRAEQIAVRLAAMGIGSCFIGCLGREEAVRARFGLPEGARIAALLTFGRPARGAGGRTVNSLMRAAVGASKKRPIPSIFFAETFDRPALPPQPIAPLIEAARHAPSAVNAQPWRFLWHGGQLHLFVKRHNLSYGQGASAQYNLHDGGLCMGNVLLALEALGMEGHWVLYESHERELPPHPARLMPLARLCLAQR